MPFAGYQDFDACVLAQTADGKSDESARRICGALQEESEPEDAEKEAPMAEQLTLTITLPNGTAVHVENGAAAPQIVEKSAFEITGRILKAADMDAATDNPIHEVTSVVLEPNPDDDTQGDTYTEQDVVDAQRSFAHSMKTNLMHASPIGKGVYIVENYIARAAFEENGQQVKKGSWIATAQIDERDQPELWAGIKSGAITTWSIEGDGVRTPLAEEDTPQVN